MRLYIDGAEETSPPQTKRLYIDGIEQGITNEQGQTVIFDGDSVTFDGDGDVIW